ncbi:MAG: FHA domain-containing protein [Bacteriovorax sp.]|nr:FHA domain-containing protein [Rhizobacter sp.]
MGEMTLAVIEILDRDGQVRQTVSVHTWPLRVGRALDNDLVLSDPHVAAHHLVVDRDPNVEGAHELRVGETRNGVFCASKRLRSGEHCTLALNSDANASASASEWTDLMLGRTRLRLRLPGHALQPELPLAAATPLTRRLGLPLIAVLVLLVAQLFGTYLDVDPDSLARALGSMLMASLAGAVVWCGAWALLSKTFTRQARFGWHLRVFLFASIALLLVSGVPAVLAFAFSWPWMSDFSFVGTFVVGAVAIYFHLLAVEPARHSLLRWVVGLGALVGIGLTLWLNVQRTDMYGEELYMNHLFPPALRLVRPVAADRFVNGLGALKPGLDKKASEPARGDSDPGDAEPEE